MAKASYTLGQSLHKLLVGTALRCPNCERGKVFSDLFTIIPVCATCGVRFERLSGESVGGMYINLVLAELLTVAGFFTAHFLLRPPLVPHVLFWVVFNLVFVAIFYRHARSMWVAVSYLSNGLYTDAEYAVKAEEKRNG